VALLSRRPAGHARGRAARAVIAGTAAIAAIAAIGATACADPVVPFVITEERVAVHGVVRAGSRDLAVAVSRIPTLTSGQEIRYVGVEDAVVEMATPGGATVRLEKAFGAAACLIGLDGTLGTFQGSGCYTARLDAPIAPGQRLDLLVLLADGTRVTGSATVPAPVSLHTPAPAARIVASVQDSVVMGQRTLELAWSAPPDVVRLEVTAFSHATGCGVGVGNTHPQVNFVPLRDVAAGTASIPFTYVGCQAPWDSFPAIVRVTAYDSVYARYYDDVLTASAVRLDRASAGLTGALGFFIASASVDRTVTFVAP
jgi:hypothetical protein